MAPDQPRNPLHGITLEQIVTELEAHFGWAELGQQVNIRCFTDSPSVPSSLKFPMQQLGEQVRHLGRGDWVLQIEEKVVNRRRQVTSAIRQDGANEVSVIARSAERSQPAVPHAAGS